MKLAVLGGSYNPIHIGHLMLADTVCRSCGYDTIAFVPAFLSPFKRGHAGCTVEDRIAMVERAVADNPAFYCEPCEVNRQGVSYTIDTLRFLTQKYPQRDGKIGLIIGDDLLGGLDTWHEATSLADYADIIVGNRVIAPQENGPTAVDAESKGAVDSRTALSTTAQSAGNVTAVSAIARKSADSITTVGTTAGGIPYIRLQNALLPVSSSGIRTAIAEKKSWRYLVPPAVYSYIKEHQLYE